MTSPALVGAALALLGLGVAGISYMVDRRAVTPSAGRERVVASHVPVRAEKVHH